MNCVERVKALCKERKIPISKLEKDLGFANGYIGQLRKGVLPADRLLIVADYFGVSVAYLMNDDAEKAPTANSERSVSDDDIKFALFGGDGEITDAMYEEVRRFAAYIKQREAGNKKE